MARAVVAVATPVEEAATRAVAAARAEAVATPVEEAATRVEEEVTREEEAAISWSLMGWAPAGAWGEGFSKAAERWAARLSWAARQSEALEQASSATWGS